MRSWGWGPHDGISALRKDTKELVSFATSLSLHLRHQGNAPWRHSKGRPWLSKQRALSRHQCYRHLDLELPVHEKWVSVVYSTQSAEFCHGSPSWLRHRLTPTHSCESDKELRNATVSWPAHAAQTGPAPSTTTPTLTAKVLDQPSVKPSAPEVAQTELAARWAAFMHQ